jgi:hypothetical protein
LDDFFVEYKTKDGTEWKEYEFSDKISDIGWLDMDIKSGKYKQVNPEAKVRHPGKYCNTVILTSWSARRRKARSGFKLCKGMVCIVVVIQ